MSGFWKHSGAGLAPWLSVLFTVFVGTAARAQDTAADQPAASAAGPQTVHEIQESHDEQSFTIDPGQTSGYDRGFFIRDRAGHFSLRIAARLQAHFQYQNDDDGSSSRDHESAFEIRRARLKLGGYAFASELQYLLQMAYDRGDAQLLDFFFDYRFPGGMRLRLGQSKPPSSREFLTSSAALDLVNRSITNGAFDPSREIGVFLFTTMELRRKYDVGLGIFNGTGITRSLSGRFDIDETTGQGTIDDVAISDVPESFNPAAALRIGYSTGGAGFSEGDLEGGSARFGFGVSLRADFDVSGNDAGALHANLDYDFKAEGFSSTGGAYLVTLQDGSDFLDQSIDWTGFFVQAGYVIRHRFQPVLRYSLVAPTGSNNNEQEATVGFSIYFRGHDIKWQTQASYLPTQTPDGTDSDYAVETQFQLQF